MSEFTVVTMDREQISRLLDDRLSEAFRKVSQEKENAEYMVDRNFLKVNFGWTRRTIERMEKAGKLVPELTADGKSKYYSLTRCQHIYKTNLKK